MAVGLINQVQALVYNVLAILIIQYLEKNPLREGLSMSCRLLIVNEFEIKNETLNKLAAHLKGVLFIVMKNRPRAYK